MLIRRPLWLGFLLVWALTWEGGATVAAAAGPVAVPAASITHDDLVSANYRQGMLAFQQRCSACHSLANGGTDMAGPNLFGMFGRPAGTKAGFKFSPAAEKAGFVWAPDRVAAYIANPAAFLNGTQMLLPEPVPESDRVALISFLMLETGGADWPKPTPPRAAIAVRPAGSTAGDPDAAVAERFPSFWNHLMKNTTRYRLQTNAGEFRFDAYFNTDGSVAANDPAIHGFWRVNAQDMFCYALYGLPIAPPQFVECFPVVAMSIPRFRDELWTSQPAEGLKLTGGIVAGRP